jgi:hypothetical protein
MRVRTRFGVAIAIIALTLSPLAFAAAQSRSTTRPAPTTPGPILLAWGVGGVLTKDGTIWQYRPEARRWVTIDQSFTLDGEKRTLLPLPVPASEIESMQGFGFLLTRAGVAWLYDLDENRWKNIGKPGS